ncbi:MULTISPECIES: hypothetical protein [Bradyrhizobium]|uniref:hypothetical protein n=1 Tax=Bradyrhizobium TaxID=374 RepID=UPI00048D5C5C|nr:hypothetical protein [Bradyrhizobium septentrionale]
MGDPAAFDQHCQKAAVQTARSAIVDVLDGGLLAQLGDGHAVKGERVELIRGRTANRGDWRWSGI